MKSTKPRFASLFSGCGGFDLGFIQAGFECIGAYDVSELALRVHSKNLNSPVYREDLSRGQVTSNPPSGIDVLIAGPPCQGFSTAGKRDVDDPRNSLITAATRIALDLLPELFILENVRGAVAGAHSRYLKNAAKLLTKNGYNVKQIEIKADSVGLPQMRRRIVLIAAKGSEEFQYTDPVCEQKSLRQVFETHNMGETKSLYAPLNGERLAIANRIKPGQKLSNVRGGSRSVHTWMIPEVFGHTTARERQILESILQLRRRDRLRDSGDADPVALKTLKDIHGVDTPKIIESLFQKGFLRKIGRNRIDLRHTFNGKYRRLSIDGLSPTVDTRFGDPMYFIHPFANRGISVREAARIQGFPDSFQFEGSFRDQFILIGNAVPPPMGFHLADLCIRHLKR